MKKSLTLAGLALLAALALPQPAAARPTNAWNFKTLLLQSDQTLQVQGTVTLPAGSITSASIAANAVDTGKLAVTGVAAATYGSSGLIPICSVTTDGRITGCSSVAPVIVNSMLSANAVDTGKILAGSVDTGKLLLGGAIDTTKILCTSPALAPGFGFYNGQKRTCDAIGSTTGL